MKLESVRDAQSTLEAFATMFDKEVSALAVVDESGALINTISPSDLKVIQKRFLSSFSLKTFAAIVDFGARTFQLLNR
jgi:hypothetical protein